MREKDFVGEWLETLPAIERKILFKSLNYSCSEKINIWTCLILYGLYKKALEALDQQLRKRELKGQNEGGKINE
jgi:hypothetical protein